MQRPRMWRQGNMIRPKSKRAHRVRDGTMLLVTLLIVALGMMGHVLVGAQEDDPTSPPPVDVLDPAVADEQQQQCIVPDLPAPQRSSAKPYQVGVLAIRGFEAAYAEFNATFAAYLTLSAGRRFDPPIEFELRPLNFLSLFGDVQVQPQPAVDFLYVNPSAYSCIESEFAAHSLVSQISRRNVGGQVHHLTKFGGVIAVRASSTDITSLSDIRGRTVAAASISGLGSGQMQFRELQRAGLSYINDPRQLVFTSNQGKVVNGLLAGKFDVAFVRTDQIERTKGPDGELVDATQIRIINPQPDLEIDGVPFPFESSTPLYPEWNLASLGHVGDEVASEVQAAMMALEAHADVGFGIRACYETCSGAGDVVSPVEEEGGSGGIVGETPPFSDEEQCRAACRDGADLAAGGRCDTTVELALAAAEAKTNGKYTGWRSTLSYMELRNMQEETNFIRRNETSGLPQCIRSSKIYDAVVCPPGHFRRPEAEVLAGCEMAGLPCDEGFQCLCRPCIKSFDVDVFPVLGDGSLAVASSAAHHDGGTDRRRQLVEDEDEARDHPVGCAKMALCGISEQTKTLRYRAIDNKKRLGLELVVFVHAGDSETKELMTTPVVPSEGGDGEDTFMYEFEIAEPRVGVVVLEIFANGEQIPESPVRHEVVARNCANDNDDPLSVALADGSCSCEANSKDIGGTCVAYGVLLPAIIIPIVAVLAVAIFFYIKRKHKAADSVWHVKEKELVFDDPPEVIGRGTFGLVLLAEYRGTQVAVKRVIPPKQRKGSAGGSGKGDNDGTGTSSVSIKSNAAAKRYSFISAPRDSVVAKYNNIRGSLEGIKEENSFDDDQSSRRSSGLVGGEGKQRRRSSGFGTFFRRDSDLLTSGELQQVDEDERRPIDEEKQKEMEEKRKRETAYTAFDAVDDPEIGLRSGHASGDHSVAAISFANSSGISNGSYAAEDHESMSDDGVSSSNGFSSSQIVGSASDKSRRRSSMGSGSGSGQKRGLGWATKTFGWNTKDEYAKLKADFIIEMRHLSKLRHPCITTVMGAIIEKGVEPMLIMEYMDMGSLHDILHNESFPLDGDLLLPILRDIAQGVRFLHAAKPRVIHGDLKAHNVLVDGKFRAKVADFGLSAKKVIGATGTPLWMAPELLRGESSNTAASDVYSFGIILYEVYSRKDPYEGEKVSEVLKDVADPKVNKRPPIPLACPQPIASMMADCLDGDPSSRPTVEEVDLRLKRLSVENVEPGEMHLSHQARKHLKARRGEDLISKMFPKHIADQLREGRKPEPENKDMVTVFFSDVVGFTDLSSKLEPENVSDMLDRLYLRFDDLADKHDVFKIETIGDAFIGVTNLVKDQEDDHAKRIAEFAIEAIDAAAKTPISLHDESLGNVRIRVGFHSGPVIASVVGSRLPKYTILGDTVNTASRMESNSQPARIQCTERAARLVAKQCPEIPISPRGEIKIKGKGELATFWINEIPRASKSDLLKSIQGKSEAKLPKERAQAIVAA